MAPKKPTAKKTKTTSGGKKAVILAGGLGSRLKPFTQAIPKPLLPIGETTVLETQITNLTSHGFTEIHIATNYKAGYIERFLGDGERFKAKLHFSQEEKPLGTCGPLSLLKDHLTEPFLLMNGDILTLMDFAKFYEFGMKKKDCALTVATTNVMTPFNFGRVVTKDDTIIRIEEKKDLRSEILAGIYFMTPDIYNHFPHGQYFGIDHLITGMLKKNIPVMRYLMKEYWLDIGRVDDFEKAQSAYKEHFESAAKKEDRAA